jgi:hypothetical protein
MELSLLRACLSKQYVEVVRLLDWGGNACGSIYACRIGACLDQSNVSVSLFLLLDFPGLHRSSVSGICVISSEDLVLIGGLLNNMSVVCVVDKGIANVTTCSEGGDALKAVGGVKHPRVSR